MRYVWFLLVALGCGAPTPSPTPTPIPSPTPSPSPIPTSDLKARHKAAYAEAIAAAGRGDFEGASRLLAPFERETEAMTDHSLAYWIHNEQTWLFWGRGDLRGALAETMLGAAALDRSRLPAEEIASMRLHALWDRAYLLLEIGDATADKARADYEALAGPRNDHDGMAVLEAFFMARRHKAKEAAAAAKRVDIDKDEDLQDLYVVALALDENGDKAGARGVRERICRGSDYLMKPLIIAQMKREGFGCTP